MTLTRQQPTAQAGPRGQGQDRGATGAVRTATGHRHRAARAGLPQWIMLKNTRQSARPQLQQAGPLGQR